MKMGYISGHDLETTKEKIMADEDMERAGDTTEHSGASSEDGGKKVEKFKKLATTANIVKAVSTVIIFGVPLAGTAALFGYGVYKVYKKIIR